MTTSDAASATGVLPGVTAVGAPGVDDATLDRIANSLLGAIPVAASPESASTAALTAARTTNPLGSTSGFPASIAPAATQTAIPELEAAGASFPLPLNVEIHDGSLPRLFDDAPLSGKPPQDGAPSYYFLTPTLATLPDATAPTFHRRLFDVNDIRRDFPILEERVHGKRLVWLDNAATTQKPQAVIDRLVHYYSHEYSNVHRAAHELAARSTDAYESAREKVQRFLGAGSPEEIVFVRGTTEAVNLVASSYGRKFIGQSDEIVLSTLEHHSNIVPWQFLAEQVGAVIRVVPATDRGGVLLSCFERTLTTRTRFVSITHVSNALGTILPIREMIQMAHRRGAGVLLA